MPERSGDFKVSAGERQVVRALGSIGSATLGSRVLGFARDVVVALAFGAGPLTDAFFVAFRIPNILRRLLAEGALSTAIIPVFPEYFVTRPAEDARRMLRAVLALALLALGLTALLGILGAPWILDAIAPGFAGEARQAGLRGPDRGDGRGGGGPRGACRPADPLARARRAGGRRRAAPRAGPGPARARAPRPALGGAAPPGARPHHPPAPAPGP